MVRGILCTVVGVVLAASAARHVGAQPLDTTVRRDVAYATHDGVTLTGDFYVPRAPGRYPVVIAVHGGAWQGGSRAVYRFWGPFLAARGVAVYAISYRLSSPGRPSFPQAVNDVRAAIQFVKQNAASLDADPDRIGLMGDSAGAHLVALVALGGDVPLFAGAHPDDPYAGVSTRVRAVVAVYGVYDLVEQWNHDQVARPRDQITEKFLGKAPMDDRRIFFDASPLSYAVRGSDQPAFLLAWGTADDIVDPVHQSEAFLVALKQAGIVVRTAPVVGAPHFWMSDPLDDQRSPVSAILPQVLRFLEARLAPRP